jgi:shikimate kinase
MENKLHIALIGFMGSGKTTVGRQLADAMRRPLFDTDKTLEERMGKTIPELFADEGEASFRAHEYRLLGELLRCVRPAVIVCGGGTPCFADTMRKLTARAATCYLQTPVDILYERLKDESANRPLLRGKPDLKQFIETLLAEREAYYRKAAFTLHTAHKSVEEIVQEIVEMLKR